MRLHKYDHAQGFTIIELVTVVSVLSIVIAIAWASVTNYMVFARDNERVSDTASIMRSFERYYRTQASAGVSPSYPTTTQINTPADRALIIPSTDERLLSPNNSAVSLSATTVVATPSPTTSQYIYQPFTNTDTICAAPVNTPCVRFLLFYRTENPNAVVTLQSEHQQ